MKEDTTRPMLPHLLHLRGPASPLKSNANEWQIQRSAFKEATCCPISSSLPSSTQNPCYPLCPYRHGEPHARRASSQSPREQANGQWFREETRHHRLRQAASEHVQEWQSSCKRVARELKFELGWAAMTTRARVGFDSLTSLRGGRQLALRSD